MLHHSGIGVYLQGLLEGMCLHGDAPHFVFYGPQKFRWQVPERLCELYVLRNHSIYTIKEQVLFPGMLRFYPLFHAPHYNIPLRFRGQLVVTIHDLNHLVYPQNLGSCLHRFYARFMFKEATARAAHIIAVSEKTREDLMERLGVPSERITVIHQAVSPGFRPCENPEELKTFREKHKIPERYLLAVGINKPHKNYPFLLSGLKELWLSKKTDIPLVIAGLDPGGITELGNLAKNGKIESYVHLVGRFSRNQAPLIYAGAEALVFPSLYEGFGLPPLEAMKTGVPVAASKIPPMPEVIGDAALFFDPQSGGELKDAILKIVLDSSLRRNLIEKGKTNLGRFDWKETARKTIEVYTKTFERER